MNSTVLIIGAGPAGIATAKTLIDKGFTGKIHLIERGRYLKKRTCPVDMGRHCAGCGGICNVLSGFGGGIHYGDSVKLSQLPAGRRLIDALGLETAEQRIQQAIELIEQTTKSPLNFCLAQQKDTTNGDYKFKPYPVASLSESQVRHFLETMYHLIETSPQVSLLMNTKVVNLGLMDDGRYKVEMKHNKQNVDPIIADRVVVAVGRAGMFWWRDLTKQLDLTYKHPQPSVGLRFELNHKWLMPAGFVHPDYKVSMFQDAGKFKSFCYCGGTKGGRIKYTRYDKGFCLLDGHVEVVEGHHTTPADAPGNFALLYQLTDIPLDTDPMLVMEEKFINPYRTFRSDYPGHPVAQKFGDFRRRQLNSANWNNLRASLDHNPSVNDLAPARIDQLFSDHIHEGFCMSLEQYMGDLLNSFDDAPHNLLDNILVIALELEGMWNTMEVDTHFETSSPGLFVAGDTIGIAQGILQAMATGINVASKIASL